MWLSGRHTLTTFFCKTRTWFDDFTFTQVGNHNNNFKSPHTKSTCIVEWASAICIPEYKYKLFRNVLPWYSSQPWSSTGPQSGQCSVLAPFNPCCITSYIYCKTLIFRETLFSRAYGLGHIHEALFSRLSINCTKVLPREILARTLISRLCNLANLRENKVLANKRCFTVDTNPFEMSSPDIVVSHGVPQDPIWSV